MPLEIDVEEELKDFDPATVDLSLEVEESVPEEPVKPALMTKVESDAFLRKRLLTATKYFSRLAIRDPGLVKRAEYLYFQAHIVEGLEANAEAKPYWQNVLKAKLNPKFQLAASEQLRLNTNQKAIPVVSTSQRPELDGLPNDPVWREVMNSQQTINLGTVDSRLATDVAMVAYDQEHLYLYARCYKSSSIDYRETSKEPRRRDGDLSNRHRVEFCIDVDRDLVSCWKIEVDWRGHAFESCGDDQSWNPKMFVARHIDDHVWSIECAIPIENLADKFNNGSAWRLSARRMMGPANRSSDLWGPFRNLPYGRPGKLLSFVLPE